ncbi:glyoxalase [Histoplasma capsulatum var. duboisii H88]|uniref:Lactoylglutathione lyase n=1 Tax=Ajellomyces capsulatus (strain H88) TaxID=544711 RepID=F0UTL3_AJEC8|nr:glyoxalase [Histoplasma capsulatum var. duboisii H88]
MSSDTSKYKLNHTMIRVKDPKKSVEFYKFLGLSLINKIEFPESKFSLLFLAYDGQQSLSGSRHWSDRNGVIELTHNYGTENDPSYAVTNGNTESHLGFGHFTISVDNLELACKRLEDAGYEFQQKLTQGSMQNQAIVEDPDGYWVAIIRKQETDAAVALTMLRVKDSKTSLKFYQEILGMTLVRIVELESGDEKFFFLAYPTSNPPFKEGAANPIAEWEGVVKLAWNYGTEKQEGRVYHDGNSEPQGFGHICVSVDDLDAACARLEAQKVTWKKRLTDGRMKNVAFVLDPDGYWVEIIQNETLKSRSHW